jgi:hypothetical protein
MLYHGSQDHARTHRTSSRSHRVRPPPLPFAALPLTHLSCRRTHKNGTWAVQKIIQCAVDEDEYSLIEQNLAPYTPPLLLNDCTSSRFPSLSILFCLPLLTRSVGNYVVQGALRFGSPHADFVFDSMVDRIWSVSSILPRLSQLLTPLRS